MNQKDIFKYANQYVRVMNNTEGWLVGHYHLQDSGTAGIMLVNINSANTYDWIAISYDVITGIRPIKPKGDLQMAQEFMSNRFNATVYTPFPSIPKRLPHICPHCRSKAYMTPEYLYCSNPKCHGL